MATNQDSLAALIEQISIRLPDLAGLRILASQSDNEFDDALEGILEQAIDYMERNANNLKNQNEVSITTTLVAYLNMPGLRVSQETHSKGHVDITIESAIVPPVRKRLGEAKIYAGPAYHIKGLEQLVLRYTTGREGSSILFEYIKDEGIKGLVEKIRKHMDQQKPCYQLGETQEHRIKWAFTSVHNHSCGEKFRVLHLNCNLYTNIP